MKDKYDSFENALEELKNIVQNFENNDDMSVDDLLKNYEQGMKAYSYCSKKLEETQKKIKFIEESYE
ncbi:MAG: exodeoxyribonuclease VII small subunit [Sedimentibacter sp.]|uniref:exodeoxyribonuclease VII small subunit n=1 Tax=Sedimentibacter sp. TaxID=1960295 RepID=UPI002982164B|nr:exodeoxyribonuclease VII small subunit [Sedimentibacter sp.]MDW5300320.1 exodeoxyribonuclease VII small subunit [Sedimentibacter sp.]